MSDSAQVRDLPPHKVQDLLTMLREIRANAVTMEDLLWDLEFKLKQVAKEEAELRDTIARKHGVLVEQVVTGPAASLSSSSPGGGGAALAESSLDLITAKQNEGLVKRIAQAKEELRKDQEAKIRLLQTVEYRLYGAPRATLGDRHLLDSSSNVGSATSLANLMKSLPDTNAEMLQRTKFFEFAAALLRTATRDLTRLGAIDVENAVLMGCQYAGTHLKLVRVASSITAADLQLL